jgi:hypothetical protein
MTTRPNQALHRTAGLRLGFKIMVSSPPSVSLGRSATVRQ